MLEGTMLDGSGILHMSIQETHPARMLYKLTQRLKEQAEIADSQKWHIARKDD